MPSKARFAVVRMWPDQPVAEHEVVERIKMAAAEIGAEVAEIDRNGYRIDDPLIEVTPDDFDFVIHTHFESGKTYDCFSYGALWNPLHFFFDWGYPEFVQNQASHDGFLTPGSRWIEDMVLREVGTRAQREDFVPLHTTLLRPIHEPQVRSDKRLFYCGVNWERLGGFGRHHHLLSNLDSTGLLSIYGPRELAGKPVWHGFRSYKGPLPFDGHAVVNTIRDHGIALVLTSRAHKTSSVASSRLFESIAAGALVLSDRHEFVDNTFEDSVLYIDDVGDPAAAARQVVEHVAWANANPEAAADIARRAQEIFKANFSLDDQLREICRRHKSYAAKQRRLLLNRAETISVDVILPWYGKRSALPRSFVRSLAQVRYGNIQLHVVGNPLCEDDKKAISDAFGKRAAYHVVSTERAELRLPTGTLVAEILPKLTGDVMIVSNGAERWFEDSVGRIVRAFEDDHELAAALGDYVTRDVKEDAKEERRYMSMHRGPMANETIANLAIRRNVYETMREYCDYLDNEHWRDFLIMTIRGPRLRKVGHHGLLVDIQAYAGLDGLRDKPLLDTDQQATVIANHPVWQQQRLDELIVSGMVKSALRDMSKDEREDLASDLVQSLPLKGLQRQIVKWLWRPLRKRARAKLGTQHATDKDRDK